MSPNAPRKSYIVFFRSRCQEYTEHKTNNEDIIQFKFLTSVALWNYSYKIVDHAYFVWIDLSEMLYLEVILGFIN